MPLARTILATLLLLAVPRICPAQILDSFDGDAIEGWFYFTGDGDAKMDFVPMGRFARISVDATEDRHNVWWAIIKRDVSDFLDLEQLQESAYELRVEARVRASEAPRRINFMLNTQRTTDFHEHLMEYEIADTSGWHTISLTTEGFDAVPGDSVFVQLGVTDWGLGTYHVDLDYYRVDVVHVDSVGPDVGEPLPYHPPVPDTSTFSEHVGVAHDALINVAFPDVNFNDWRAVEREGTTSVLTVSRDQWVVLRWDFGPYENTRADGAGLLELTAHSVARGGDYARAFGQDLGMEFGKVRVVEILDGDPAWDEETVTYASLTRGDTELEIFNSQMVFDFEPAAPGSKTYVTIARPVLQRLLDGTTKGLLLRPLGALEASFYASEEESAMGPTLHFDVVP